MAKIVGFKDIPLGDLEIGKGQVRLSDVDKDINELADSIQTVGLLEPILVAPTGTDKKFEIILGQRRFLAHQELGRKTITAGILNEQISERDAKVLSVTENLIRRDLNRKDMIDVCTYLYKRYGSMTAVADETGLPYNKVREYVRYDRLIPELRHVVDTGDVELMAALRAQDAAATEGDPDPEDAIKLAKEMSTMSNAQQKKIQQAKEDDPTASVDELIEHAKSGGKVTQIQITLGHGIHMSLTRYAKREGTSIGDAAAELIETGLSRNGYDLGGGIG